MATAAWGVPAAKGVCEASARNPEAPHVAKELSELVDRDPYIPLRIRLSNGDTYDLLDPRGVVVMKSNVFFTLPDARFKLIALIHIVSVESVQAA